MYPMTPPETGTPRIVHSALRRPIGPALAAMPKVLLHDHLDGSLRVSTLIALCRRRGIALPTAKAEELAQWFRDNAMAGSLERYLQGFALTVAAMGDLAAIEQVAFEAAEDARAEGCALAEFRMAPLLLQAHGVDPDEATAAMLAGLARSNLPCGLIVCGMRHEAPERVGEAAQLALRHRAGPQRTVGVVGFDLAGPERGWPATHHAATLQRVREAGLPITLHAGEADEGQRVLEAVALGARRIGHGVRLADLLASRNTDEILHTLREHHVHLEVCPTSNVQTGAARSIAEHPIRALWQAGVSLSFHTDNHLISCTNMNLEAQALMDEAGFNLGDLAHMQSLALEASFLSDPLKAPARARLAAWCAEHLDEPTAP
jgi:adenosine deaminase